jgi:hypothetical protein
VVTPEDRLQIARQESAARIVNMIVDGLWGGWGEKAFLMYRAFASEPYSVYRFWPYHLTLIELSYKSHHPVARCWLSEPGLGAVEAIR